MDFKQRKNLIFDLDGTLIDSSEGVVASTNYALQSMGETIRTPDEIRRFIGYPLEEMFASFSDKSYNEFLRNFQNKAKEVMAVNTVPIGRAEDVLETLYNRGYRIGIGTTKIRLHIRGILNKLNWDKYVIGYIGADDVANVKPAPDAFIKAMAIMDADSSNSVVIGDTINDIIAAKSAGIPTIAVKSIFGGDGELKESDPDRLIDNLEELLDIFK
ncbi:MAG: HAD-IA family hydrolase [candidate division Zixibacteria bacterium]|nr:HAD-IA family hydrolase [candidate division Zixibacteria bacterium]